MQKDIRNSIVLKTISFIFIPIFAVILIFSSIYTSYLSDTKEVLEEENFYKTEQFSNCYRSDLYMAMNQVQNMVKTKESSKIQNELGETIYYTNQYGRESQQLKYLMLENDKIAYTNYELNGTTDSIQKIKERLNQKKEYYWNYTKETNKIDTNVKGTEDIKYTYFREEKQEKIPYTIETVLEENPIVMNSMYFAKMSFQLTKQLGIIPVVLIPVSSVLMLVMAIYLCFAIGHKKGKEEIYLTLFDQRPIDVLIIISGFLIGMLVSISVAVMETMTQNSMQFAIYASVCSVCLILAYAITVTMFITILKRLKTKTFLRTTLTYRITKKLTSWVKKVWNGIFENFNLNNKIIFIYIGFLLLSIILWSMGGIGILLVFIFWGYCLYRLLQKIKDYRKIQNAVENIYQGKTEIILKPEDFKGELQKLCIYVNDIAGGFSNAIEESLKSERLKTELITNVSHDIKTPLTSIINYVDLLKQENIQDEKVKEYIDILDNKSQRLKKLTEDLVEASKVSSGNVKLKIEQIHLKELIHQTTGEFKDKFEQKGLIIDLTVPEQEVKIKADNRYMYRIIENLFSNITKYALDNSRVYIDVRIKENKVKVSMKNISKEKLNISSEELMQRFVRGDRARTTEGSGLGISITKSLTEIQNGSFTMKIDGDLFKVELEFEKIT